MLLKRKALALILMLVLLFSVLAGTWFVNLAKANPSTPPDYVTAPKIFSPQNKTYSTNIIPLNIITGGSHISFAMCLYSVDGGPEIRVEPAWANTRIRGELNLTDGSHSILVTTAVAGLGRVCAIVHFTIAIPPVVTVLSLENKTYYTSDVMLNFTVNEPVTRVAYSLDGQKNVTVFGNTTLTRLTTGSHNIVVYAWDTAYQRNVGASETINFTIAEPEPEPFPTTLVAASVIAVAVFGAGLLVYFSKRKH